MNTQNLVFIGLKSHVIAIEKSSGREVWSSQLKGGMSPGEAFVSLLVDGAIVYAHTKGELFALSAENGEVLWVNDLQGMGYGLASIAVDGACTSPGMIHQKEMDARRSDAMNTSSIHTT